MPFPTPTKLAPVLFLAPVLAGLFACEERATDRAEAVDFAEASFRMDSPADCSAAFDGRFLTRVAQERDWTQQDIDAFCTELDDIRTVYADNATLTTVAIAGVGQIDDATLETAYFVGASGYDLTAIQSWLGEVRASAAVRQCVREARSLNRSGEPLEAGFARTCLEDATGSAFPAPLFSEQRSSVGLDDIGDAGTGLALGLAIHNVPNEGTVVSFLGGGFYAQADPAYGAFIGCGAAIGFADSPEDGETAALCIGAEY